MSGGHEMHFLSSFTRAHRNPDSQWGMAGLMTLSRSGAQLLLRQMDEVGRLCDAYGDEDLALRVKDGFSGEIQLIQPKWRVAPGVSRFQQKVLKEVEESAMAKVGCMTISPSWADAVQRCTAAHVKAKDERGRTILSVNVWSNAVNYWHHEFGPAALNAYQVRREHLLEGLILSAPEAHMATDAFGALVQESAKWALHLLGRGPSAALGDDGQRDDLRRGLTTLMSREAYADLLQHPDASVREQALKLAGELGYGAEVDQESHPKRRSS